MNKIVLVQLFRLGTDSRVWVKAPAGSESELLKTGDCAELERAMIHDYPDWFVVKWAVVPKDSGEEMLCYGLEEIFQFDKLF